MRPGSVEVPKIACASHRAPQYIISSSEYGTGKTVRSSIYKTVKCSTDKTVKCSTDKTVKSSTEKTVKSTDKTVKSI